MILLRLSGFIRSLVVARLLAVVVVCLSSWDGMIATRASCRCAGLVHMIQIAHRLSRSLSSASSVPRAWDDSDSCNSSSQPDGRLLHASLPFCLPSYYYVWGSKREVRGTVT